MFDKRATFLEIINGFIPDNAKDYVVDVMINENIHLKVSKKRTTKKGDYRSPDICGLHTISVNRDLNIYAFLFTFIHEYAHLLIWKKYKNRKKAHGKEWKFIFRNLLIYAIDRDFFPEDIKIVIKKYIIDRSSFSGKYKISIDKSFQRYDINPHLTVVADLHIGNIFMLANKRQFKIIAKLRTRFKCVDMNNNKIYIVSGYAEVIDWQKE
ncbi:MAG: SprT-like domain-containing protein [Bacteroidota bacterium]